MVSINSPSCAFHVSTFKIFQVSVSALEKLCQGVQQTDREKGIGTAVYHLWKVVLDAGKQTRELFLQDFL